MASLDPSHGNRLWPEFVRVSKNLPFNTHTYWPCELSYFLVLVNEEIYGNSDFDKPPEVRTRNLLIQLDEDMTASACFLIWSSHEYYDST